MLARHFVRNSKYHLSLHHILILLCKPFLPGVEFFARWQAALAILGQFPDCMMYIINSCIQFISHTRKASPENYKWLHLKCSLTLPKGKVNTFIEIVVKLLLFKIDSLFYLVKILYTNRNQVGI